MCEFCYTIIFSVLVLSGLLSHVVNLWEFVVQNCWPALREFQQAEWVGLLLLYRNSVTTQHGTRVAPPFCHFQRNVIMFIPLVQCSFILLRPQKSINSAPFLRLGGVSTSRESSHPHPQFYFWHSSSWWRSLSLVLSLWSRSSRDFQITIRVLPCFTSWSSVADRGWNLNVPILSCASKILSLIAERPSRPCRRR